MLTKHGGVDEVFMVVKDDADDLFGRENLILVQQLGIEGLRDWQKVNLCRVDGLALSNEIGTFGFRGEHGHGSRHVKGRKIGHLLQRCVTSGLEATSRRVEHRT